MPTDPFNLFKDSIMFELDAAQTVDVGGALSFGGWVNLFRDSFAVWSFGMEAIGGTLSNYYGPETTLDIINGGNLGA